MDIKEVAIPSSFGPTVIAAISVIVMRVLTHRWCVFALLLTYIVPILAEETEEFEWNGPSLPYISGCNQWTGSVVTYCDDDFPRFCGCTNFYAMSTYFGCLSDYNAPKGVYTRFMEDCLEYENATITMLQIKDATEYYKKHAKYVSQIPNFNATAISEVVIRTNKSEADTYINSFKQNYWNYDNSIYYGSGLLGYWALVFLISGIVNWSKLLFPGLVKKFTGPISNKWRKYVSIPALYKKKRATDHKVFLFIHYLVPSRMETIVIFLFAMLIIGVCSPDIYYIKNDPVYLSKLRAVSRLTADRAAIVSLALIPLLILLAGRNNFLLWLTRLKFSTFITYHRWIARFVFVLVLLHACCYTYVYVINEVYSDAMKDTYFHWGVIAVISAGLMMGQGLLYLRRNLYEIFLLVHIILGALFVAGGWLHTQILGYVNYFYAATAVWCFDRAVRIVRICLFGFPNAEVKLYCGECLKVVVPRPRYWHPTPGAHAFIHFIRPTCFWQSHPFTFTVSSHSNDKIFLYCKVKGGMTHGLYKYLSTSPNCTANIRVALEGPYGGGTAARKYDTAVFIAGGNGIPGMYSEIYDIALRTGGNSKQVLKLKWIIRTYDSIIWFYDELMALKNTHIQTTIFVTKPGNEISSNDYKQLKFSLRDSDEKSDEYKEGSKVVEKYEDNEDTPIDLEPNSNIRKLQSELSHIEFREFRPSIDEMIETEIEESNGSVCFVSCGHPQMVDDVRYAVLMNLETDGAKGKRIELFEQLQIWA